MSWECRFVFDSIFSVLAANASFLTLWPRQTKLRDPFRNRSNTTRPTKKNKNRKKKKTLSSTQYQKKTKQMLILIITIRTNAHKLTTPVSAHPAARVHSYLPSWCNSPWDRSLGWAYQVYTMSPQTSALGRGMPESTVMHVYAGFVCCCYCCYHWYYVRCCCTMEHRPRRKEVKLSHMLAWLFRVPKNADESV